MFKNATVSTVMTCKLITQPNLLTYARPHVDLVLVIFRPHLNFTLFKHNQFKIDNFGSGHVVPEATAQERQSQVDRPVAPSGAAREPESPREEIPAPVVAARDSEEQLLSLVRCGRRRQE
jgi:hypothetical protein